MTSQKTFSFFLTSLEGGGAERVFLRLMNYFCQKSYGTHLFVKEKKGTFFSQLDDDVRIEELNARQHRDCVPALASQLRRLQPDVLLSTIQMNNVISTLAHTLAGRPGKLILRIANHRSRSYPSKSLKGKAISLLAPYVYRLASRIICVSRSVKNDLSSFNIIPDERMHVIYNPIDLVKIKASAKEEITDKTYPTYLMDHPFLLSVGRLSSQKDYATLIRAFKKLRSTHPEFHLVILGEGKERQKLRNMVDRLRLDEFVYMPGYVENPYPWIRASKVFVSTSRWEGCPNVILESLSMGTPVVATDCEGGTAELLQDGSIGTLTEPRSPSEITNGIVKVLQNPPSASTLQEAVKKYSIENIGAKYEDIFLGRA